MIRRHQLAVLQRRQPCRPNLNWADRALHTYTIGFAALEASRADWTPDERDGDDLGRQLAAYTSTAQFTEGLRYLAAGIGRPTISSPES